MQGEWRTVSPGASSMPFGVMRLLGKLSTCGVSPEFWQRLVRDLNDACDGWNMVDEFESKLTQ